jgi:hypothetical protein
MAFKQEVNVPLILTIGIVSGIMILVIVIGTQAWYESEESNEVAIKAVEASQRSLDPDSPTFSFPQLKQGQLDNLSAKAHWVDETKKDRMTMPIDDAVKYLATHDGKMP